MKPALYPSQVLQPGRAHSLLRQSPILDDKYDHPSLRASIISNFRTAADGLPVPGNTTFLIATISDLCGPDSLQPADKSLREEALDVCASNHDQRFMHTKFWECLGDGKFDTEPMITLLGMIGPLALEKWTLSDPPELRSSRLKLRMLRSLRPPPLRPDERCRSF